MFFTKGKECNGCRYEDIDINAKNFIYRIPCIDCSRLYKDYFIESEDASIPDDKFKCIKCHKIVDASKGMRSSNDFKKGICLSCFNKT